MAPLEHYENLEQLYDGFRDNLSRLYDDSLDLLQFIPLWNDSNTTQIIVRTSSPAPQSSKTSAAPSSKRSLVSKCVSKVLEFEPFYLTEFIYFAFFAINYFASTIQPSVFILLNILLIVQFLTAVPHLKLSHERATSNFERMNKAFLYMTAYKVWSKRVGNCSLNAIKSLFAVRNDLKIINDADIGPDTFAEAVGMINDILARWSNEYKPVDYISLLEWFPQAECLLQRFITSLKVSLDVEQEFMHFMRTTPEPTWYELNGWEMENEEMEQCLLRISRAHKKNIVLSREVYKIISQSRVFSSRHDFFLDSKIRKH